MVDLYDVSDDWIPIYDRSDLDGFYMAVGTSGNQYKNAPRCRRMMAELIERCENGQDHDRDPVQYNAVYTGRRARRRLLLETPRNQRRQLVLCQRLNARRHSPSVIPTGGPGLAGAEVEGSGRGGTAFRTGKLLPHPDSSTQPSRRSRLALGRNDRLGMEDVITRNNGSRPGKGLPKNKDPLFFI